MGDRERERQKNKHRNQKNTETQSPRIFVGFQTLGDIFALNLSGRAPQAAVRLPWLAAGPLPWQSLVASSFLTSETSPTVPNPTFGKDFEESNPKPGLSTLGAASQGSSLGSAGERLGQGGWPDDGPAQTIDWRGAQLQIQVAGWSLIVF